MKVLELFGGIGSCTQAMKRLGIDFEVVDYVEIDKYAVKSYNAINGTNYEPQDITKWDKDIKADFIMHGSPCFVGDTLVLTNNGYKELQDVNESDTVLTHSNEYKSVTKFMEQGVKRIYEINAMGSDNIRTTSNHKFYTREKGRYWDNESRSYKRCFSTPKWTEAKDLSSNSYIGYAINQNSIIPEWKGVNLNYKNHECVGNKLDMKSKDLWYLVGRYLGDGWIKSRKDRNSEFSAVVICCGKKKAKEFESKIGECFPYIKTEERTVFKYTFSSKELAHFLKDFGMGAINKRITGKAIDLPTELLEQLILGYTDSDGCFTQGSYKYTSISKNLLYGLQQCIAKVYKIGSSIYAISRPPQCIIESRIVNQKTQYQLAFRKDKKTECFYEDNTIWYPVRNVNRTDKFEAVYDITVDGDHSFTANGVIAHNCQDFSVAGLGKGASEDGGTRSSLMYETIRIVDKVRPKYVLWENVKNVLSKKHRHNFDNYLSKMEELGYHNYFQVLNAKDFGIPQNRERIFVLSCLEDIGYKFPQKQELTIRLKDILEDEVEEKYYISSDKVEKLIKQIVEKQGDKGIGALIKQATSTGSIYCKNGGVLNTSYPDSDTRRGRVISDGDTPHQAGSVWGKDGLAPTLDTMQGGWRQPCVLEVQQLGNIGNTGHGGENVYSSETISPCVKARDYKGPVKVLEVIKIPLDEQNKNFRNDTVGTLTTDSSSPKHNNRICQVYPILTLDRLEKRQNGRRCKEDGEPMFTLTGQDRHGVVLMLSENDYFLVSIRKLTPKECWRLMGFTDDVFEKAEQVNSNSQLYKQAGNSIVVNVLAEILRKVSW